MCGITGYIGERNAQPILVNSLKRLEYRGYDSCGIACLGGSISVTKDVGRIGELERRLPADDSKIGIGHTRWATHGKPSPENAHPHLDCSARIAVVHNGVITNFQELKEQLLAEGHTFRSETDTEVIPHLIEKYYQGNLEEAVARSLVDIKGSCALAALHSDCPYIVVVRNESPLIVGLGDGENFVASDVPAVLDYTDRVIYLEDGDIGVIGKDQIRVSNNGREVKRAGHRVSWTLEQAQKAGYEHFMLKEIHEQPRVIENTYRGYVSAIEPVLNLSVGRDVDYDNIFIVACGTSYHAALVGKHLIQRLARIPVRVELASEFNYSEPVLGRTWVIGITQSGETADTLKALGRAKGLGARTLAITNVVGSSATRVADETFYIAAGPEICVAATKSFLAQLIALYLLAFSRARIEARHRSSLVVQLRELPSKVEQVLAEENRVAQFGHYLAGYDSVFFVARGLNFPVALEGALKLKEIAYIHAEGYAAGELKHGPFALLTPQTPVVAVTAGDNTYETLLTNLKEIKARESPVVALADESDTEIGKYVDWLIPLPSVDPLFSPVVNSVVLQLLAYYAARERGCSIDLPRNLAKSVTVE